MNSHRRLQAPRGARAGLALLGAGALAAMSLAAAPAAHADPDFLQISHDGSSFAGSASQSVFPEGLLLIPGTVETGSFWVRNNSSEPAYLSLAVAGSGIAPELAGYLELRSRTGAGDEAAALPGNQSCSDLGSPVLLPAGAAGRVDLSAGLVLDAPNATMNQQSTFDVLLLLDAAGGRSACQAPAIPEAGVPAPGGPAAQPSGIDTVQGSAGMAASAAAVLPGTGTGTGIPAAAVNAPAPANAAPANFAKAAGNPVLPPRIAPASFIESTVEPIIRTWQGTLTVLLAVAFFAAAAARIRITRRTP